MAEADTRRLLQPPGMNISECGPKYLFSICLGSVLGRIYEDIVSLDLFGLVLELIPLTRLSGFCNPLNFTRCVVEEDGLDFWRRNLSGSFNENEGVPDFDFVWSRTREILGQSRGPGWVTLGWFITRFLGIFCYDRVFVFVVSRCTDETIQPRTHLYT